MVVGAGVKGGGALLVAGLLGFALVSEAAPVGPAGGAVRLRSATVAPGFGGPWGLDGARELEALGDSEVGIFLARGPLPGDGLRRRLEAEGVEILRYLPEGGWLIRGEGARLRGISQRAASLGVDVFEPWRPAWKVAPEIEAGGYAGVVVHLFPGADPREVAALLAEAGAAPVTAEGWWGPRVAAATGPLTAGEARALARRPEVFWIEARGEARLLNDQAVPLIQSGESRGPSSIHDAGLRGEGQLVGYIDTGLDYDGCFFRDDAHAVAVNERAGLGTAVSPAHRKVHAYDMLWAADRAADPGDYDNHGHGSHVGGNIGGASVDPSAEDLNGVAPAARFIVQDGGYSGADDCADLPGLGCPVVDLLPFFEQARAQGARIHTNSWGDNENSSAQWTYSAGSEDVDAMSFTHKDMLLIFAAGNSGPGAGTVGSPSTAKNAVAVGGSGNGASAEWMVPFSSRGPTADGRVKPDVLAPAANTSAASDRMLGTGGCETDTGAGTSYAAPLVAGAAALVRQYFEEGYYPSGQATPGDGFSPSAALMKATLIASAAQMARTSPIPSFDQGWGRIQLDRALRFGAASRGVRVVDGERSFASSGEAPFELSVEVAGADEPLSVTLVWTDAPSSPAAAINLVNDLDLSVQLGGTTWLGNRMAGGRSIPGGEADRLNNVERVVVPAPRGGRARVVVTPHHIPEGPQDFALVVTGELRR